MFNDKIYNKCLTNLILFSCNISTFIDLFNQGYSDAKHNKKLFDKVFMENEHLDDFLFPPFSYL